MLKRDCVQYMCALYIHMYSKVSSWCTMFTILLSMYCFDWLSLSCFNLIGIIPETWKCYTVPPGLTVLHWVTDFSKRIEQLQKISNLADKGGIKALRVGTLYTFVE